MIIFLLIKQYSLLRSFFGIKVRKNGEIQKEERGFPILGRKAPDFEAATTQDTLRPSDYQGTCLQRR